MTAPGTPHAQEVAEEREDGSERTASALFLEMGFAERPEQRQLKWAWAWTLGFQFLIFAVVVPSAGTTNFTFDQAEATVIRRYKPPEIERPKTPRKRRKAPAVPIPDPTPSEYEPLVTEEDMRNFAPEENMDAVYEYGLPWGGPPDGAIARETVGLVLPALLEQVEPQYDADSARRGVQGAADVEIVISTEGLVSLARILNSTTDDTLSGGQGVRVTPAKPWISFAPATKRTRLGDSRSCWTGTSRYRDEGHDRRVRGLSYRR